MEKVNNEIDIAQDIQPQNQAFTRRLDFYWQSISIYAIILFLYSLLRGTIVEHKLTLSLTDPVVLLLSAIIVISSVTLAVNLYTSVKIIVGDDYIIFKSRFGEKKYSASQISKITFKREKIFQVRGAYSVIIIKLRYRSRRIRIRPSSYWDEKNLIEALLKFRK